MITKEENMVIVFSSEVPDYSNILDGRFVSFIKDKGTDLKFWKVHFIVPDHRGKL